MRIIPIGEMIAADIQDANLSQPLDDVSIAAITEAWNENLVLRFRNQQLSDADLIRFSSYFGELDPPGPCLLYTSPSPRDMRRSRMPSSA